MVRLCLVFCVMLAYGGMFISGCSSTRTRKTEVVTEVEHNDAGDVASIERRTESSTTTTDTDTEDEDDGCGGILSCTVDVVGSIIAFPFRVVGGLIEIIF